MKEKKEKEPKPIRHPSTEVSWMKAEREYFSETFASKYGISEKALSKALHGYNIFLQKALIGESPFVAEDLRITIEKLGGEIAIK